MSEETTEAPEVQEPNTEAPTEDSSEVTVPLAVLKKQEREAKKLARELEQLKTAEEERKQAEMTELERYKAQAEQAAAEKAQLERRVMIEGRKTEALKAASAFADPEVALRFVDLESEDLDSPEAIQEAVAGVLTQYPYLAKQADPAAGPGRVGAAGTPSTPSAGEPASEEDAVAASFLRSLIS